MILLRLLNVQGIAGIAASLCLAVLLLLQKGETRHWRSKAPSSSNSTAGAGGLRRHRRQLPRRGRPGRAADKANAERVRAEQAAINERSTNAFETRLADARAHAGRLRLEAPTPQPIPAVAEPRQCPAFPLPPAALLKPPVKTDFLPTDALTATEQAIQLDELIKWVRAQAEGSTQLSHC